MSLLHLYIQEMRNLVVVESPTKSRTVKRYLNELKDETFEILATGGHIYEIAPGEDQVNVTDNFKMNYNIISTKRKFVNAIVKAMKESEVLYLATDPDREGEAISAHVYEILEKKKALNDKPVYRIVFYEITKDAIIEAIREPGEISSDLVQAQKARAALDYLMGFNLSPVLWRKLSSKSRSAGRVQSPALRLIVERQREIQAFKAEEFWTIEADLFEGSKFTAKLTHHSDSKLDKKSIKNQEQAEQIVGDIEDALERENSCARELKVIDLKKSLRNRRSPPPLTTSTLVQEASRRFRMNAKNVMSVAQQLYEGVVVNGQQTGLITYIRTDSVTLSENALKQLRGFIRENYGSDYLPDKPNRYKTKSRTAQEAHEAIRPTNVNLTPAKVKSALALQQHQLYELIWQRTVAGQMVNAVYEQATVELGVALHRFRAAGSILRKPGYLTVYRPSPDAQDKAGKNFADDRALPALQVGQLVKVVQIRSEQHFTQPPARYNQASLVKKLEEFGIGRPSTYASIITKLIEREYVSLEKQVFYATQHGCVVNDFLVQNFSRYIDYDFTAKLEEDLDKIARGDEERVAFLDGFWNPFNAVVQERLQRSERFERKIGSDPHSGRDVLVKFGKSGPYIQIGRREDEETPKFLSLPLSSDPGTVTFEQIKESLSAVPLPRTIEDAPDGFEIIARSGRFGPYISVKTDAGESFNVTITEGYDPHTLTAEQAMALIQSRHKQGARNLIQEFDGIQVLNGRYGPYVTNGKINATIPKRLDPEILDLETCKELLENKAQSRRNQGRKTLHEFGDLQVLEGRYGPYVTNGKINASIPKGTDLNSIDAETCQKLIAEKASSGKNPRRSRRKN